MDIFIYTCIYGCTHKLYMKWENMRQFNEFTRDIWQDQTWVLNYPHNIYLYTATHTNILVQKIKSICIFPLNELSSMKIQCTNYVTGHAQLFKNFFFLTLFLLLSFYFFSDMMKMLTFFLLIKLDLVH